VEVTPFLIAATGSFSPMRNRAGRLDVLPVGHAIVDSLARTRLDIDIDVAVTAGS
jgi:hypothetical protein